MFRICFIYVSYMCVPYGIISKVTVSSLIAPPFDISTQLVASVEDRPIAGDAGRLGDGH